MPASITTAQVWDEIERRSFAVLSYVTPRAEARSAGVVYVVRDGKLYVRADSESWKADYIRRNPAIAFNVSIPKRLPLLPWIRIPDATIAFHGRARVINAETADAALVKSLDRATYHEAQDLSTTCFIEVTPEGHFATYGVGVSRLDMREPEKARARVAVA